jgi:hypothetical protein
MNGIGRYFVEAVDIYEGNMKYLIEVGDKICLFRSRHNTCKLQNFNMVIDHDKVACEGRLHDRPAWCALESINENQYHPVAPPK